MLFRSVAVERGAYVDAFKALGPVANKSVRDEPSDLMLAADVARLSQHPGDATRYLARVSDGFPRDKRAPLAAVANAIRNATVLRLTELPISPPKVLAALSAAS